MALIEISSINTIYYTTFFNHEILVLSVCFSPNKFYRKREPIAEDFFLNLQLAFFIGYLSNSVDKKV